MHSGEPSQEWAKQAVPALKHIVNLEGESYFFSVKVYNTSEAIRMTVNTLGPLRVNIIP